METEPPPGTARSLPAKPGCGLHINVDGFEGPLDLLLALARSQKVDLRHVSIVQLADQYLAFIADARRADLELAAAYLVMAAWLADLKSRLLLPDAPADGEPSGAEMAGALAFQLRRLEAMRSAGKQLLRRPRLGREVFARGAPDRLAPQIRTTVAVSLFELLSAYGAHLARSRETVMRIDPPALVSVDEALDWLRRALGRAPGWETLESILPAGTLDGLQRGRLVARSALAAAFSASLELARSGDLRLRQLSPYGPILIAPRKPDGAATGRGDQPALRGPE